MKDTKCVFMTFVVMLYIYTNRTAVCKIKHYSVFILQCFNIYVQCINYSYSASVL